MTTVDDILEHYGTKGMKWGVRKDASRADKKWAKNIYSMKGAIAVHNRAAEIANAQLPKLNSTPKYKEAFKVFEKYYEVQRNGSNKDEEAFEKTPAFKKADKVMNQYYKEVQTQHTKAVQQAVKEIHGTSPSGGYQAKLILDRYKEPSQIVVTETTIKHADTPAEEYIFELESKNGVILKSKLSDDSSMQTSITTSTEILEHYGTKGMKWGVRKQLARRNAKSDSPKKTKPTRPGTRTYDPKKLSNQELKAVVARMRLEQEYVQLNNHPSTKKGNNAATKILKKAGEKNIQRIAEVGLGAMIGLALTQAPKMIKSPQAAKLAGEIARRF